MAQGPRESGGGSKNGGLKQAKLVVKGEKPNGSAVASVGGTMGLQYAGNADTSVYTLRQPAGVDIHGTNQGRSIGRHYMVVDVYTQDLPFVIILALQIKIAQGVRNVRGR